MSIATWFKKKFHELKGSPWRNYQGDDRKELVVKFDAPTAPEVWLEQLADERQYAMLPLVDGVARAWVRPGPYSMGYRGNTAAPNRTFNVEITDPPPARWKPATPQRSDGKSRINDYHNDFTVS